MIKNLLLASTILVHLSVLADGVIFATSDDIKAFDNMLKKQKIKPKKPNTNIANSLDKMIKTENVKLKANSKSSANASNSGSNGASSSAAKDNGKALGKNKIKTNNGKKK